MNTLEPNAVLFSDTISLFMNANDKKRMPKCIVEVCLGIPTPMSMGTG